MHAVKILLLPILIAAVVSLFGFTNQVQSQFGKQLLLDACFNYINDLEQAEGLTITPQKTGKDLSIIEAPSPVTNFALPDTTIKGDTIKLADTTHVVLSKKDSLLLKAKQDSLKRIELLSQDSTARLKYFRAERSDYYSVPFRTKKTSAFFIQPSAASVIRTAELDSTGTKVIIKEKIAGQEAKVFIEIPLEEYIKLRLEAIDRDLWEQQGYKYEIKSDKKDLSQLITDITNIDIPLPSTSILSIFGPPKINLKISGSVDIHGAWRNETTTGVTTSAFGNTRNEPDFKQQVQINLSGTIGDKLNLSADWNTERQFQYENQLKIKYTGYDDEIIQSIEAGNVSLQTSPLVGGSEALFGVKALMKMGPFSLTALASQKKGEVQEVSVSGGSKSQTFTIRAYNYSQNHFFIDSIYANKALNIFNDYYGNPTAVIKHTELRVKDIEVWKSVTGLTNKETERKANAFIDLKDSTNDNYESRRNSGEQSIAGRQEVGGRFVKLTAADYTLHDATGFISFKTQIQDNEAIAVAYRTEGPTSGKEDDVYYGQLLKDVQGDSTVLVLKLIKPKNLQPQFKDAWKLQLRNIYPIGGMEIQKEGFELDIKYEVSGSEAQSEDNGVKYLQEFGLDKYDASGTNATPDGNFDFDEGRTILSATGEIIFPVLQPFGDNFSSTLNPDYKYDAVYDTTVNGAQDVKAKDKFIITGKYSASTSSVYNVGFNVVENSVKVYLDNTLLQEGADYSVDYNLGQVIIRNSNAVQPGRNLRITYEQNDLFQLASKTLIGLRGLYEFNKETTLGFSFLNLNQQTLSDKVRIGEEPLNNSIYGVDFKTSVQLPFITKALDKVISTSAPSSWTLNAEYAYINPDPNTKKSTVASDQEQSIAYIDDFEGTKKTIPIGVGYTSWKDISVPDSLPYISKLPLMTPMADVFQSPIDAQMNYKTKAYWYNIPRGGVSVDTLFGGRRQATRDQNVVTVLDLVYLPNQKGYYNWYPSLDDKSKNWAGIMKPLSTTASNLTDENIEFIEFWVNVASGQPDLRLNIDLGQISEDVIPNGVLDTEDGDGNDNLEQEDDTGLDGLGAEDRVGWFDAQEPGYNSNNTDPSNDNYTYASGSLDFLGINGTEGNSKSVEFKLPDTEDLDRNFTIDAVNSYFRYEVKLDTNQATNPFIQGKGGSGWYLYRIPLKDYIKTIGNPSLSVVETIRLWISGVDDVVQLRFAEMNLVGNQWEKVLRKATTTLPEVTLNDTVLTLSTISVEDNPAYKIPPGVNREKDRTQTDADIFKNEQSLNLVLDKLDDGDNREVVKYLYKPLDLFNYKEMKFFVHADDDDALSSSVSYYRDTTDYSSEVYIRFGTDSTNFYEYRQPMRTNPAPLQYNWSEVALKFSDLTAIKQQRDSSVIKSLFQVTVGSEGQKYGIRGNPSLTKVTFFLIGILNPKYKGPAGSPGNSISGSVWLNELRVLGADDTPGWAYTASTSLALADLMRLNFNISQTNPYFHKLGDRFGNRINSVAWSTSVDLDVLKVLPVNLPGSNLRVVYSRNEQTSNPIYMPGTDIKISSAQEQTRERMIKDGADPALIEQTLKDMKNQTQTVSVSETWTLSNIKIKIPTELWYIRDTFNSLSFSFNYNKSSSRSPTVKNTANWMWNASANYSVAFSRDLYFKPLDIPFIGDLLSIFTDYKDVKIYFAPQSVTASVTANRKRNYSLNRNISTTATATTKPSILRDFTSTRGAGFNWTLTEGGLLNLSMAYNFDISSTLARFLIEKVTDEIVRERSESEIWSDIFGGNLFGDDINYRQNFDLRANPKLPSFGDINRYVTLTTSYGVSYSWQNNLTQGELGRSAGYSNRITAGLTIRLKSMVAPLFKSEQPSQQQKQPIPPTQRQEGGRGGRRSQKPAGGEIKREDTAEDKTALADSTAIKDTTLFDKRINGEDTTNVTEELVEVEEGPGNLEIGLEYLKLAVKWILFDYDQISINFSQSNSYAGGALAGAGTGFNNFWGINQSYAKGPSRLFMLGLSNDLGPRAKNGNFYDNFTRKNDLNLKTSRPLWEGAQLDINWSVGWSVNQSYTMQSDSLGNVAITNISSTGAIDRSFFSLPLGSFSLLGGNIKKVHEKYVENGSTAVGLSDAFVEGFEGISLLAKIPFLSDVTKYIPRPNWSFSWSGLEKYSIFSFAKRVSLQHSYSSKYSEGWKINPDGDKEIQTQRVDYGFSPLVGLTFQFDQLFGGNFQSSARFSTKTGYSVGASTRNITETFSNDINITASYSKTGFELPLFGLSLKNDLEISFSYTRGQSTSTIFDMDKFDEKGRVQDGKVNTTIEPKIKYVMSSRVTLSIFYRRTSIDSKGANKYPPTVTNEAGLDVHIAIQ